MNIFNMIVNSKSQALPWTEQRRLLFVGSSGTFGRGAGTGTFSTDGAFINSPSSTLASGLTALGINTYCNSLVGTGNTGGGDSLADYFDNSNITLTHSNMTQSTSDSVGGGLINISTAGSYVEFELQDTDLIVLGMPVRTYGIVEYTIDGGTPVQFSQHRDDHSGVDELLRLEIPVTLGTHTVRVAHVSGIFAFLGYVEGINTTKDMAIIGMGARGYSTEELVDDTRVWSYINSLAYIPFTDMIFNLGANDVRQGGAGTDQATYEARVNEYLDYAISINPTVNIILMITNDISTGLSYLPDAVNKIAGERGLPVIDQRTATNLADYATAVANNLMDDTLHKNLQGYLNVSEIVTPAVFATLPPN